MDRPTKRAKLGSIASESGISTNKDAAALSLSRPISPPSHRVRQQFTTSAGSEPNPPAISTKQALAQEDSSSLPPPGIWNGHGELEATINLPSPFKLTRIRDLSEPSNHDTVSLKDVIGNAIIKELWSFNYLTDIDFLREALDEDTRHLVKINVVHGFWKKEDQSRLRLEVG